ncbi:MAG: FIG00800068: hypothetical protein [uncultured Microvirga sp.]|uniref:Uncharacterized protein n=1 Tax=uncultured Microvirga sp. TaxID=412392 RepID=A0A6J4KUG5_9HYPH|nr:MAG: FIG00800068: hypothetical protein [uncultured Microvirga sp.]
MKREPALGRRALVRALTPLIVSLLSIVIVAATGLTTRSLFGTPLEDRFYGFFLDRYPLFLFAVCYGAAVIIAAAFEPGWRWGRMIAAPLGAAMFLALCLHPTFGGLVLRSGYMIGTVAFLSGVPTPAAVAAGAAASALVYGLALGLGVMLARLKRPRLAWGSLGRSIAAVLALWLGAVILAAPWALGMPSSGWPARALTLEATLIGVAIVAMALLPHAATAAASRFSETRPEPATDLPLGAEKKSIP